MEKAHNTPNRNKFLVGLALGSVLIMTVSALIDLTATAAMGRHASRVLVDIMGRTLFEGELPGVNDPLALLLLAALGVYLAGWLRPDRVKWAALRPQAGFILISALVVAFLLMHGIKLSQGRARPDLVLKHGWPFTAWYAAGPHFIGDGLFRGSFPSGHTSLIFSSMAFAYALFCDPYAPRRVRILGMALGLVVVCLSLAMGLARCMSLSHWLSDVTGSICLGWIVIHLLYFNLLMVPAQRRYYRTRATHLSILSMPAFWELRMGGWMVILTLGLLVALNGLRALWQGRTVWLAWFLPAGLALIIVAVRAIARLRRRLAAGLAMPADPPAGKVPTPCPTSP